MNIKWNHKDQKWPQATADLRDYIYIVSDGEEMTIARWVDLCHEDPNCGADPDEFEFLPVKDIEVLYWYGPVCSPICDISDYQPEQINPEEQCEYRFKKECKDKESTHYFMCHMTQKEFDERRGDKEQLNDLKFNVIQPDQQGYDEPIKKDDHALDALRYAAKTFMNGRINPEEQCELDILLSLKGEDSYGVLQVLQDRFGRYFRPVWCYPDLSPDTHVESIVCGNLLYETAISSRIDMKRV